jgi:hypothetical protein
MTLSQQSHSKVKLHIMKIKFLLILFSLPVFISCEDENKNENEAETISIEGITEVDNMGVFYGNFDDDDWNLDDQLTEKEKQLFASLDFSKTGVAEPIPSEPGVIPKIKFITFYPNPFSDVPRLSYYHNEHILNLVIVDNKYNILYSYRVENSESVTFNFDSLKTGIIYRMYYVVQDKNYNIIHCGHGDIKRT